MGRESLLLTKENFAPFPKLGGSRESISDIKDYGGQENISLFPFDGLLKTSFQKA